MELLYQLSYNGKCTGLFHDLPDVALAKSGGWWVV